MAIAIWAVIFLVGVPGHARASDYFDAATGTIHLREVAVGDVIYKRVGVGLGQVQSLAQGAPRTATSIYLPSSGLLSIPFIRAETTAFTNAAVSITDVRYVESDLRAKTPLPSGETYGACKAAVLAAWQQTPRYIDPADYQAQVRLLESSTTCYGFGSEDIIPAPRASLSWGDGVHINTLFLFCTFDDQILIMRLGLGVCLTHAFWFVAKGAGQR